MAPVGAEVSLAAILSELKQDGRHPLTPREQECIALLLSGQSHKRIAASLGITVNTVRRHMERVHQKLRVSSAVGAAVTFLLENLQALCQPGHCAGLQSRLRQWPSDCVGQTAAGTALARIRPVLVETLTSIENVTMEQLSPREKACMVLLMRGLGDKQIAEPLNLAPGTVHTLLGRARRKLRQPSRARAAAAFALLIVRAACHPGQCGGLESVLRRR